ncbi:DUF3604 domain-containing protein [Chlamydiifrater volucris]|uniref:DUF3604 domain-containing protein n=1 Tax=Chlamydiifrater volucris TaxID=2681470 RepID=UPI001BCCB2A1|nr:DUF3604 domain-containing protein [Chlamydiifrater volucris]
MRRSVCYVDPSSARAGQISTWQFLYNPAMPLPKGTKLKFDLQGSGRVIDWEVPTADLTSPKNVIYAKTPSGKIIKAKPVRAPGKLVPQFEFVLPSLVDIGETLTIVMGVNPEGPDNDELGNGSQLFVQRRKPFLLHVDTGNGEEETEVFSMDIRGNVLKKILIFTPSYVTKNKRFDITVRFEDEFGNLTNFAPESTRVELSYEHLRENLSWQLFIPETGFVVLPNLYFNETGIYRIKLRNLSTNESFVSAPVKCFPDASPNLMWGLLHGESERLDAEENIESCLRHFRDEKAFNFFASSSFEGSEGISSDLWKLISQNISDFNEEDRFVTVLGFQYAGNTKEEGIRHILSCKDNKSHTKQRDNKHLQLTKLYKNSSPKDFISIPCFTASKKYGYNFDSFHPEFERVVEIYNAWGSSETTEANGNPFPIKGFDTEEESGTIIHALKRNKRFGFVAGGYDDRGPYSTFFDNGQIQYSPGFTGIVSSKYTRESLMDALFKRHCYATSGPRIILGFHIAQEPMGTELSTAAKPGLMVNRHISGYVAGTSKLQKVEIIRNGDVLHTFSPQESLQIDYEYDDMTDLSTVALSPDKNKPSFAFYYLRVTQVDGAMAWSSPIWVDVEPSK